MNNFLSCCVSAFLEPQDIFELRKTNHEARRLWTFDMISDTSSIIDIVMHNGPMGNELFAKWIDRAVADEQNTPEGIIFDVFWNILQYPYCALKSRQHDVLNQLLNAVPQGLIVRLLLQCLNPPESKIVLQPYGMRSIDDSIFNANNVLARREPNYAASLFAQVICYSPYPNTNVLYFALENLLNDDMETFREMVQLGITYGIGECRHIAIRETGDPYFMRLEPEVEPEVEPQ